MGYYRVVRNRNEKENEAGCQVILLIGREEKLNEEVSQEDDAYPKLHVHELRYLIKGFVVVTIYRDADYKKNRETENQQMKTIVNAPLLEYMIQTLGLGWCRCVTHNIGLITVLWKHCCVYRKHGRLEIWISLL